MTPRQNIHPESQVSPKIEICGAERAAQNGKQQNESGIGAKDRMARGIGVANRTGLAERNRSRLVRRLRSHHLSATSAATSLSYNRSFRSGQSKFWRMKFPDWCLLCFGFRSLKASHALIQH